MKAILYEQSAGAALREVPVPSLGPGEALVAVDACGLCGTDLMKLATRAKTAVLGHELAGRVEALGAGVEGFREGDRVVVAHHVPCLECHYCRRGSFSMCRQFKATNIDPGGFAEFVRVPALHVKHTMLRVPEGLSAAAASQAEPLACCLRNARRLGVRAGDTVGLIGLGAIGLLTAMLLKHLGADVLGLDLDADRAERLGRWGEGFTNPEKMRAALLQRSQGRGLDSLIISAGSPALVAERLSWLRDGGALNVFASFHPESKMALDLNEVYHRELTVVSSYSPALEDLKDALDLIASGAVPVSELPTKTFALSEFDAAVEAVRSRGTMKAVLAP